MQTHPHHKVELKPPVELVEAIQNSEDMTAPQSAEAASELTGPNVPRSVRNKLEHEEPQKMTEEQRAVLEERAAGGDHSTYLADPTARREHEQEMQHEQLKEMQYDRQHPGAGRAGHGDNEVDSMHGLKAGNRIHMEKGPHFKDHKADSKK